MKRKNRAYLEFVRTLPCAYCGAPGPNHAHHIRTDKVLFLSDKRRTLAEVAQDTGQESFDLEESIYCAGGCGL